MPKIESISVLRKTDQLDKVSKSKSPLFVTKNGKAYLVIMSHQSYDDICQELDHYRRTFEREREIKSLATKVNKSRQQIAENKSYSEGELDEMMEKLLS